MKMKLVMSYEKAESLMFYHPRSFKEVAVSASVQTRFWRIHADFKEWTRNFREWGFWMEYKRGAWRVTVYKGDKRKFIFDRDRMGTFVLRRGKWLPGAFNRRLPESLVKAFEEV